MKKVYLLGTFFISIVGSLTCVVAAPLSRGAVEAKAAKIDQLLSREYTLQGITPQPFVSEEVFLRRSYLGIIGRIPTVEEALDYFGKSSPEKDKELIDQLSNSPGYSSHLTNFMGDLLRVQSALDQHGLGWSLWVKDSVKKNLPYDEFVSEMLTATGHCAEDPATGYYLRDLNMLLDNVSNTMQTFLGVRVGCAQCHDHPFDDWSQREFYEIASYSARIAYSSQTRQDLSQEVRRYVLENKDKLEGKQVNRKKERQAQTMGSTENMEEATMKKRKKKVNFYNNLLPYSKRNAIADVFKNKLKLPHDYKYSDAQPEDVVHPRIPFGEKIILAETTAQKKSPFSPTPDRRESFAHWLTSPKNPYFAKTIANRLWKQTFGTGLAEPVDDWTSGDAIIPFPDVLNAIEELMVEVDYDLREFQRVLWHTELFKRSAAPDPAESQPYNFAGPRLRRMTAAQLYDSSMTLSRGNIDSNEASQARLLWEKYQRNFEKFATASPAQHVTMEKAFQKYRKEKIQYRDELFILNTRLKKVKKNEDSAEMTKLRAAVVKLNKDYSEFQRQSPGKLIIDLDVRTLRVSNKIFKEKDKGNQKLAYRFSELPAPLYPSHQVRQFGSSDRETTDASHTKASIPQVLSLYNGDSTASLTNYKKSNLFKNLLDTEDAADRLNYLFLSLYARLPNDDEKINFTEEMSHRKGIQLLTRAALNSKRFLFIE